MQLNLFDILTLSIIFGTMIGLVVRSHLQSIREKRAEKQGELTEKFCQLHKRLSTLSVHYFNERLLISDDEPYSHLSPELQIHFKQERASVLFVGWFKMIEPELEKIQVSSNDFFLEALEMAIGPNTHFMFAYDWENQHFNEYAIKVIVRKLLGPLKYPKHVNSAMLYLEKTSSSRGK